MNIKLHDEINETELLADEARSEDGQALAEYALILAFIAAVCVAAVGFLGLAIAGGLDAVTAGLP